MNEEKELQAIKKDFEAELKALFNKRREDVGIAVTRVEIINDPMTGECLSVTTFGCEVLI